MARGRRWLALAGTALAGVVAWQAGGFEAIGGLWAQDAPAREALCRRFPRAPLCRAQSLGTATAPTSNQFLPAEPPGGTAEARAYLARMLEDIQVFWSGVYTTAAIAPQPGVRYSWPARGERAYSQCTTEGGTNFTTDVSVFYCPADDTIFISAEWARRVLAESYDTSVGVQNRELVSAVAIAFAVAHEYGHNVEFELGLGGLQTTQKELLADCFAGAWTYSAFTRSVVSDIDVERMMASALLSGDFQVGHPQHHGRPFQRADWFEKGYASDGVAACVRALEGVLASATPTPSLSLARPGVPLGG